MSRTSRLFLLMDALRGHRRPVTAGALAERLGVSERTIYRDIQTLSELGAPVQGEAGVGYLLRAGAFLPPLMFDSDELEALVLGARWVKRQGDAGLSGAAASALAKIATASPRDLRDTMADLSLWVPIGPNSQGDDGRFVQPAREAIRHERKLRIGYQDEQGVASERIVWPIALAFMDGRRLLAAWCELRGGFRHFRIDRIASVAPAGDGFPRRRHALLAEWRAATGVDPDS